MAGKRRLWLVCLLLVAVLPIGCEQQPAPTATVQATPQPTPTETSQPTEVLPSPTATQGTTGELQPFEVNEARRRLSDLSLIISSDRRYVNAGEPVRIRFTVVNNGDAEEIREAEEGPIMDILVRYRSGGSNRIMDWWSDGREITPEMRRLELGPSESRTIEMTWIPPDMIYAVFVDLSGVFHGRYRDTDVWTYVCVEDGCAGE